MTDAFRLKGLAGRDISAAREAIIGVLKETWASLPAIVDQDSDGHVATLKSAVKMIVTQTDGSTQLVEFPLFDTAPVHYPGGGGVSHTHPVKKGDEGVALFMSMPQDGWHKQGGVQDPIDGRRHHLSDGRLLPGGRSDPRKLDPPVSTTSQQSRSDDGAHVFDLHPGQGLTAASSRKHLVLVGGSNGSGTLHLVGKIIKNAEKVLINCIKQTPLPDPGSSFANRKLIATTPVGALGSQSSGIAGVMSGLMSGGASTLFASPIASQVSALSSAITSGATALGGVGGAAGLISGLTGGGGLSSALSSLSIGASNFSGATTPTGGDFGLSDVLTHAQGLSQFFGSSAAPSGVLLSTVLAPLQSGPSLATMTDDLNALISAVVGGSTSVASATATVATWTTQIAAYMTNANGAISTLGAAAPLLNLALAAAGAGAGLDANEAAVAGAISNANLASLTQMISAVFALSEADLASAQAFPDTSAAQAGATGGM